MANPGRVGAVRAAAAARGWESQVTGDRADALERLERSRVDVVVVDVETSGAGEGLLADVRLRHPDTIRLAVLAGGGGRGVPTAAMAAHRILSADDDDAAILAVLDLADRLAEPALRADAFCAGLLHECGQLVFASCRPVVFSAHLRLQQGRPTLCGEIEQETFGVTHSRAGAYLLRLWGFPLEIASAA